MPRIRHWFHVSHDINSDGEVWELTDKFGVAGLRLWLELLSIADRNEGGLPPFSKETYRHLSIKCNTRTSRVIVMLNWCTTRRWVVLDPSPRVRNWAMYNPSREGKKEKTSSPPTSPPHPNPPKDAEPAKPAPSADLKKEEPRKLDPAIKAAADPIYLSKPEKFARLIVWIKEKEKRDLPAEVITTTLRAFWVQEQKSKVADWWPYMNRIFTKEYGRWNEEQAQKHKAANSDFVRGLLKSIGGKP